MAGDGAGPATHTLTDTAVPQHRHASGRWERQKNSKYARPKEGPAATSTLTADPDSGVTSAASSGESNGESDYVESCKNLPMRLARTLEL